MLITLTVRSQETQRLKGFKIDRLSLNLCLENTVFKHRFDGLEIIAPIPDSVNSFEFRFDEIRI